MINQKIVIDDLFTSKKIKDFCNKNKLTDEQVMKNIVPLSLYKEVMEECEKCDLKKRCASQTPNMTAILTMENDNVKLKYVECDIAKSKNPNNLEVLYYNAVEEDVYINKNRSKIFTLMQNFLDTYQSDKLNKGFYIYGKYGTGKSFLAYKFAQQLTEKGLKVIFAYYPDLIRQIKNNIGTIEMERLINKIKTIEILFLDDLGAENNTAFVRDDILSPILQYRMNNNLSTFITSNCSLEQLVEHFSETNYDVDKNKAGRIIDRISYLTIPVEILDVNYRNDIK